MIDWIKISDKLPYKDCIVLVKVDQEDYKYLKGATAYFIMNYRVLDKIFIGYENDIYYGDESLLVYENKLNYAQPHNRKQGILAQKLTHWSYINEPEDK